MGHDFAELAVILILNWILNLASKNSCVVLEGENSLFFLIPVSIGRKKIITVNHSIATRWYILNLRIGLYHWVELEQ
jgi:hypothetical protein